MSIKASAKTLGVLVGLAVTLMVCLLAPGTIVQAQPAASDLGSNPFANDPAAPAAGRALFDGACSACHGTGAGGSERAPALNSGTFQHGGADTDLFQTIRAGVPNTAMPAFTAMPTDNVWKLVTYIKSLSGLNGPRGTATGNVVAATRSMAVAQISPAIFPPKAPSRWRRSAAA
jgi:mono/diheme cytochrome c family protein